MNSARRGHPFSGVGHPFTHLQCWEPVNPPKKVKFSSQTCSSTWVKYPSQAKGTVVFWYRVTCRTGSVLVLGGVGESKVRTCFGVGSFGACIDHDTKCRVTTGLLMMCLCCDHIHFVLVMCSWCVCVHRVLVMWLCCTVLTLVIYWWWVCDVIVFTVYW